MNPPMLARPGLLRQELLPPLDGARPWRLLPAWLALALALRALVALGGDFVLHPDEIMQYLEPAHKAVYGYGVTYWEFYVGARSWIVPGFVAAILWLLELVGLGTPAVYVYVVKLAFCLLSLLVPWGAYHFARRLVGESAARVALVLACVWPYIVVFAHKPFTEFVATSLFFAALGVLGRSDGSRAAAAFAFGALLGAVAMVRLHYIPTAGLLWLAATWALGLRFGLQSAAAGLGVVLAAGALDWLTWGRPFQSYFLNIVMNLRFDQARDAQEWYFYLHRLLFVSAGGALVAIWAVVARPRRLALVAALFVVTLLVHSLAVHKELRFVYVLHGLWIIALASFAVSFFRAVVPARLLGWAGALAGAFFVAVVSGALSDQWLHRAHSQERGDVNYLFGQSNMFEIYLELSRDPALRGVAHISDPYFNTPGYYYLHRKVPFYDAFTLKPVVEATPDPTELERRFSHIVGVGRLPPVPSFMPRPVEGEYQVSAATGKALATSKLASYSPVILSGPTLDAVNEYWPLRAPPPFPRFVE